MTTTIALASLPVIVPVLVLGAVLKLAAVRRGAEPEGLGGLGPTVLLPERLRRPAIVLCALVEFAYAVALPLWDHPLPRWGAVVFFTLATYVLVDLKRRRPEAGCGCFGEVSRKPVGLRSIGRAMTLGLMTLAVALSPVTAADLVAGLSWTMLGWTVAAAALVLLLSPEIDEMIARMRYRAPCELREAPVEDALSRLTASAEWRERRPLLVSTTPVDTWRELCWRFFVYEGRTADGDAVDVVFAVHLDGGRHAPVRSALVAADGTSLESLPESIPVSA
ncbi:hypothetical protein GCM10010106_16270 [Thermopolyspora flexuosa]|uniref:Methylamine utilization protein MauE n=1 Tax=Thermopolyspora flexuosa TaxID=103836 RepID=A0A543IPD2_9ACTN|nr:MauE/DoxX family redox-associated membrane protein [Thermopolyspora flexuosa]TQM72421.1 methylamine utilization protein MauE [Thermopolyspora flexuosa]GGM70723.1 hypothetical protein GCM10010106_16270 [Thermopolyspora flexuosa]